MKSSRRRHLRVATFPLLAALCLVLAACGSSSRTTTSSAGAAASGATGAPGGGSPGAGRGRFASLRTCLAKQGINLPARRPGQGPPAGGGGGFLGRGNGTRPGLRPPAGVSAQAFAAAMQKCGGGAGLGRRLPGSPAFKEALTKFAACMSANGIKLPPPNTTGNGPVFNTRGLDTTRPAFRAANTKCSATLRGTFPGGGASAPAA